MKHSARGVFNDRIDSMISDVKDHTLTEQNRL